MKKIVLIVIFCIILLAIFCNKTESFTNTIIKLIDHDFYQIKDAIDQVAYNEYYNALNKIGENNIKIIIDTFKESIKKDSMQEQKNAFESNIFIKSIFKDEAINLSDNFKQSLFIELREANLFDRNLNMIPLRLYVSEKIVSKENMKKIIDKLNNIELKKITSFFILYLLKYYDISQPNHKQNEKILRFTKETPTIDEINSTIQKNPSVFFN